MSDVEVREATTEDVTGIRRVAVAGWRAAYAGIMGEQTAVETARRAYDPERLAEYVTDEGTVYLVAVTATEDGEDRVVGYTSGTDSEAGPGAELGTIYVHPDRQGEGVGSGLFAALRERLRERGFERVRAVVLADNDAGLPFYEARRFERVGWTEEIVDGEAYEALVVARAL